jgi:Phage integrase family
MDGTTAAGGNYGGAAYRAKDRRSRVGWEPLRTVLLIMLDSGLRPSEIFRMRWENIHWDKRLIFNPRGKSRRSRRYVPLTERMKLALLARKSRNNEGWVFPSKRSHSGHITDREVSKQCQAIAGYSGKGRFVLCAPPLLDGCGGGHGKCACGEERDGARIRYHHSHLHAYQCGVDSGGH